MFCHNAMYISNPNVVRTFYKQRLALGASSNRHDSEQIPTLHRFKTQLKIGIRAHSPIPQNPHSEILGPWRCATSPASVAPSHPGRLRLVDLQWIQQTGSTLQLRPNPTLPLCSGVVWISLSTLGRPSWVLLRAEPGLPVWVKALSRSSWAVMLAQT